MDSVKQWKDVNAFSNFQKIPQLISYPLIVMVSADPALATTQMLPPAFNTWLTSLGETKEPLPVAGTVWADVVVVDAPAAPPDGTR